MNDSNFPYAGFNRFWQFSDDEDTRYSNYLNDKVPTENILNDIKNILIICEQYEILFPTYYIGDDQQKHFFQNTSIDGIIAYLRTKIFNNNLTYEIKEIGGYGYVYIENGMKARQENLISIENIRFFERAIDLYTKVSVWSPIRFDNNYHYEWQIELANNNAPRLEKCLQDIYHYLAINVYPPPKELDKEEALWQYNFKLYPNQEILKQRYHEDPPDGDISNYFLQ